MFVKCFVQLGYVFFVFRGAVPYFNEFVVNFAKRKAVQLLTICNLPANIQFWKENRNFLQKCRKKAVPADRGRLLMYFSEITFLQ